jgi:hypothetical protein
MKSKYERIVWGDGATKKFEFYHGKSFSDNDIIPVRENTKYKIVYTSDKKEFYFDYRNNQIVRIKNPTLFSKYKNAKGSLTREYYLNPHQITLTKVMKKKQSITRYFAQYKLDPDDKIFEISKASFGLQADFYKKVSVQWQLQGSKENILLKNNKALEEADKTLRGIINYIDPLEFYEGEKSTPEEELQKKLSNLK